MKTVYVHAWEYCNGDSAGGGGFEWYHKAEHADGAFGDDGDVAPNEGHFRFDFETDETDADAITAAIDADLIDLCARATVRKVGPVLLAYWQANDFKMGDGIHAAA